MKITIEAELLFNSLTYLQGVVENNSTNRVLSHVLLSAKDSEIELYSTDTLIYLKETVPANVSEEGAAALPFDLLYKTLGQLKSKNIVSLTLSDKGLMVECNGFKGCIQTLDAASFPLLYQGEFLSTCTLPTETLRMVLGKTKFAICADETRYNLNGIYLHQIEGPHGEPILAAAATDGHKLAMASAPVQKDASLSAPMLIPKKTVEKLYSLLEKIAGETITVSLASNLVSFSTASMILQSQLIDGTFPEYKKVIPAKTDSTLRLSTKKLIEAIDLVEIYSESRVRFVKLVISGNLLTVKANKDEGVCYAEKVLPLDEVQKDLEIAFNSSYLKTILHLVESEEVNIELSSSLDPVLIRDTDNQHFSFVLMPMRF